MPDISRDEMRLLLREQAEMLAGLVRSGGGGSGGVASGMLSSFNSAPLISGFVNTTTSFTSGVSEIIKGNAGLQGALDLTRGFLLKFGEPGRLLAGTFLKVVETGVFLNDGLRKTGENGLYFNNNIFQLARSVNETRMSFDQFLTFMSKNSMAIAGLGPTAGQAAINFTKAANDIANTEIGSRFQKTANDAQFLNQTLANVANVMQYTNMSDTNARKRLIDFSAALAERFDDLARITGVQRAQIQEQVNKQLSQAGVIAYMNSLEGKAKEDFIAGMTEASKKGPEFAQAFAETQAFGNVVSEQSRGLVASLGGAQEEFYDFNAAVKEGGDITRASNNLDAEMALLMKDETFQRRAMLAGFGVTNDASAKGAAAITAGSITMKRDIEAAATFIREGGKRSMTAITAEIDARAREERETALTDPASQFSIAFNTASQTISRAGIAATTALESLASQLTTTPISDTFNNIDNIIKEAFNADKIAKEIGAAFQDLKKAEVTPQDIEKGKQLGVPIPGSYTIDVPNQNKPSTQPVTTPQNQPTTNTPPVPPSTTPSSSRNETGILDMLNQHLSTISNYMRDIKSLNEQASGFYREMRSAFSNNRGAP